VNTLIIGATSAVAACIAAECAGRGERLYLIARDGDKLALLARSLGDAVVGTALGDFRDTNLSAALVDAADARLGGIDSAFIAHGVLSDQLETERSYEAAEDTLRVNLLSYVSFVIPIANLFESRGRGSLVVISSVAGDRGRPRNYSYGAAKGGLTIYLQGVRSRLYRLGVRVVTVHLGPVDTPMTASHEKNLFFARKEDVAKAIVRARSHGPSEAYVPWFWRPIMFGVRNMPEWLFQRLGFLSDR
jgi:decaprenylphospho-beta-D-erythro-pentofuranosid-2-ulose 2-reductase